MRKHRKLVNIVLREDIVKSNMFGDVKYRLCKYNSNFFIVFVFVGDIESPIAIFKYQDIAVSYYNSIIIVGGYNDEMLRKSLQISVLPVPNSNKSITGLIDTGIGESISRFVIASEKGIEMVKEDKNEQQQLVVLR